MFFHQLWFYECYITLQHIYYVFLRIIFWICCNIDIFIYTIYIVYCLYLSIILIILLSTTQWKLQFWGRCFITSDRCHLISCYRLYSKKLIELEFLIQLIRLRLWSSTACVSGVETRDIWMWNVRDMHPTEKELWNFVFI